MCLTHMHEWVSVFHYLHFFSYFPECDSLTPPCFYSCIKGAVSFVSRVTLPALKKRRPSDVRAQPNEQLFFTWVRRWREIKTSDHLRWSQNGEVCFLPSFTAIAVMKLWEELPPHEIFMLPCHNCQQTVHRKKEVKLYTIHFFYSCNRE